MHVKSSAALLAITVAVAFVAYVLRDSRGVMTSGSLLGGYLWPLWQRLDRINLLGLRQVRFNEE